MTAALPLLIPGLPPGTGPARPAQSAAASDLAGLFALLLAGQQPVPLTVVQDAGSRTPAAPAFAPALLAGGVPTLPTTPSGAHSLQPMAGASGSAAAVAPPPTAPGLPAIPAPAHGLLDSGGPPPQPALAPQTGRAPAPVATGGAEPSRAALPPLTGGGDPHPDPDRARGRPDLPSAHTGAIVARSTIVPSTPVPTESTAARPEMGTIAPATDAKPAAAPSGASLHAAAPAHLAGPASTQPTARVAPAAHGRTIPAPAAETRRAHAAVLAPAFGSPRAAATESAASDASDPLWLEAGREAEGVVSRADHAASELTRAQAPGRPVPPAPVLQIGVHIARAVPARIDRLVVQLEPAGLGRVEVRLKFHRDDQVSAVIAAERPDTLDALQRDARLLERSLQHAGLRLDGDGLTFSLKREQAHHQPHEDGWFAPSAVGTADQPPPAHEQAPPLRWFQGLRALDIRV